VAAGAADAEVAADVADAVAAAVSGSADAAVAVVAAAGSVASGSVAARVARLARAAADPGERAACVKSTLSGLPQQPRCWPLPSYKCKKQPSDDECLPLALDNAFKRMPMFAGKRDHLRCLCLRFSYE
jgi:hypothetical protein